MIYLCGIYWKILLMLFLNEEGFKQGIKENQILTAKNIKNKKMDTVLISELTGLSVEEIKEI